MLTSTSLPLQLSILLHTWPQLTLCSCNLHPRNRNDLPCQPLPATDFPLPSTFSIATLHKLILILLNKVINPILRLYCAEYKLWQSTLTGLWRRYMTNWHHLLLVFVNRPIYLKKGGVSGAVFASVFRQGKCYWDGHLDWDKYRVIRNECRGFNNLSYTSFFRCNPMWFLSMGLGQRSGLCSSSSRKYPATEGTNQNRHWYHHRWHATNNLERTRLSCSCL